MKKYSFVVVMLVLLVGCTTAPVVAATAVPATATQLPTATDVPSTATAVPATATDVPTATEVPTATAEPTKMVLLELATVFPDNGQYKELPEITEDDINSGLWQKAVDELNAANMPLSADIVTIEWDTTAQAIGPGKSAFHPIGPNEKDRKSIADSLSVDEIAKRLPIQPELGYSWIKNYHGRGDALIFPVKFYNSDKTSVSVPVVVDVKTWLTDTDGLKYWGLVSAMFFRNKDNSATLTNVLGYLETGLDFTNSKVVGLENLSKWKEVVEITKETKNIPSKAGLVAWPLFCYRWK